MNLKIPKLIEFQKTFISSKDSILLQWVSYEAPQKILKLHNIDNDTFLNDYFNISKRNVPITGFILHFIRSC